MKTPSRSASPGPKQSPKPMLTVVCARLLGAIAVTCLLLFAASNTAIAQPAADAPAQPASDAPTPATSNANTKNDSSKAPLTAEQIAELDQCRALANTTPRLRAQLKNDLQPEIQEADAAMTVRNKKHVIMAYAALWILTVGFLVLLFIRQRRLLAEIDRLRGEVAQAAAD